ncbi:unnamed protein product, partial [Mesorhabditis belari]|uniref:Uncharacterized protein n=1 Tax=Mesorhabditis belari TaxID=2138241 RepID=A0AAF3J501_9BILA
MHQRALSFQSDPTQPGLLEISGDTLLRFQAFLESGGALVLFIGVFTSLLATYYSAKNDNLLLSVRLILTGENVQRFVYTIIKMANYLCTVFSISGCSIDGIAGSILYNGRSLSIMIAFCQMFVSFSRFMAVSFDGIFISLFTIVQYPFFGYFLSNVALLVNSNVSTYIYTLGLSYINMVYLKKKLSSGSEKERYNNAVSPRSGKSTLLQKAEPFTQKPPFKLAFAAQQAATPF